MRPDAGGQGNRNRPETGWTGLEDFFLDSRRYTFAWAGILALGLSLSLLGLQRDIWLDEYLSIKAVNLPTLGVMLAELRSDTSPPLYFMLLRWWSAISGHESFLRLFSILVSLATLLALMRWLKPFSPSGSLLGGLFLATFPLALRYAVEIRGYGLLLLFTTLALGGATTLAWGPRRTAGSVVMGLSLAAAVATHLVGVFLLLPVAAFLILVKKPGAKLPGGKTLAALAAPAVLFLWFYVFFVGRQEMHAWWMPRISWGLLVTGAAHVLQFLAQLGPLGLIYASSPGLALSLVFVGVASVCLLSALFLAAGDLRRTFPFLLAAALYWLQLLVYSALAVPIFWDRTLLPSLAPLAGFVGLQAATLRRRSIRLPFLALSAIAALAFSLTWIFYWSPRSTEQCWQVAQVLKSQWRPADPVVVYPSWAVGPVQHYFPALPSEAVMGVNYGQGSPSSTAALADKLSRSPERGINPRWFLLIRLDTSLAQHPDTFREVLRVLGEHRQEGEPLQVLLSFDIHINLHPGLVASRSDVLAELENRFGPPRELKKFEAFYWLRYGRGDPPP